MCFCSCAPYCAPCRISYNKSDSLLSPLKCQVLFIDFSTPVNLNVSPWLSFSSPACWMLVLTFKKKWHIYLKSIRKFRILGISNNSWDTYIFFLILPDSEFFLANNFLAIVLHFIMKSSKHMQKKRVKKNVRDQSTIANSFNNSQCVDQIDVIKIP